METFTTLAQEYVRRVDAGESAELLAGELHALRAHWQRLSPDEREQARGAAASLASRTRSTDAAAPRARQPRQASLLDEQAEAQRALQGLEALVTPGARRVYDGPPDPDALLAHYGLASFRPGQRRAVEAALAGRDGLVIMPTGGGKSLCYILPGLASPRLTVVVSPLIALMSDQYRKLAQDGHPAVMLASGLSEDHNREALAAIRDGSARITFCSPERFASRPFVEALATREIALFAVDEAHCLSEWGHDFRPDYLRLRGVIEQLGSPPTLACTATATPMVAEEITTRLALRDPSIVHGGFDRPNLSFDVLTFEGKGSVARKFATLAATLKMPENRPAIVYAGTRKDVESVASELRGLGLNAVGYHAGMAPDERASAQFRFLEDDVDVVVATNAFGMGVDKPNVRCVVHYATPTSIEAYYQEAGRAGRDGAPARAVLLASRADLGRLIRFNENRSVSVEAVAAYVARLERSSDDGVLTIPSPREDTDRIALAVAERAGALVLAPAGGGNLRVTLGNELDWHSAREIVGIAKERGWSAYRAIERFTSSADICRRRQILEHFGDRELGTPTGRCCDVCDPIDWLPSPAEIAAAVPGSGSVRRGRGGGGGSTAPPVELDAEGEKLFQALAAWRREAADGKPAYTVAHNSTLATIAVKRPRDGAELLAISGIGRSFVEKYAADVLALVADAD
jgi:ATP-dependent DNA helicase RecQ